MSTDEVSSDTVESLPSKDATDTSKESSTMEDAVKPNTRGTATIEGSQPSDIPEVDANERFTPSGMNHPDYSETLIRRWEPYQVTAVRAAMAKLVIDKLEDLDAAEQDDNKFKKVAELLGTALVKPVKPGVSPQLHRRGLAGVLKMRKDCERSEIIAAFKVACVLNKVFS